MKKIHLLYLTLLAICILVGSCKDEEEEMTYGKGGILTGIWGLVDDDGLYVGEDDSQYGINISYDGKIQRVRFSGTEYEPFNDYVDGIIQQIYPKMLIVLGNEGEYYLPFMMDTIVKEDANRLAPFMRLHLTDNPIDTNADDAELDKAPFPVSGTYIKRCVFTDEIERLISGRDAHLFGEWKQQFGTDSIAIFSFSGSINGHRITDWYARGNVLYILMDGVVSHYTYSVVDKKLILGEDTFHLCQ